MDNLSTTYDFVDVVVMVNMWFDFSVEWIIV